MRNRFATILAAAALAGVAGGAEASTQDFASWLQGVRTEARERGIREATLDAALAGLQPIPKVIELDRRQPEGRMTFQQYMERVVTPKRIETGRARMAEHADLLARIAADYGVQPRFIVALWGIETSYGSYTGSYPVVASLATLAHDGRRSSFFRRELMNALTIVDQGHIPVAQMDGSWAGAMGQSQFMPSSFLSYAVDRDGDGRRDIWTTLPDVFASIANYLAKVGWRGDQYWGREVSLPPDIDAGLFADGVRKPLEAWASLGVRRSDGGPLPVAVFEARLGRPGGSDGPVYLAYGNYDAILRWNRSNYFAMAVGALSDAIDD